MVRAPAGSAGACRGCCTQCRGSQGDPSREDVQIAREEDQGVEVLRFEGDACASCR